VAELETRLLINGEQVAGEGQGIEVENPFTEETLATVGAPSDDQLDAAIASAREASREWAATPAPDRGELLHEVAYGLGANVYTQDFKTILRCMREIKAGTVWFNDPLTDNDAGPFGGFKQSALGRELGREGLEAFQETKHVHIESELAPKEWWYPYSEYTGGEPPHGAQGARS
jgi:acyl-CoA reductase-like NAD-dependent aldehyde dehydrogenase